MTRWFLRALPFQGAILWHSLDPVGKPVTGAVLGRG